ncbi:MAG: hypothetical protein LH702_29535 [Phormidesmis sp. CAN_BIN44]|nr:hypothetical protein [Phormidesmis sp. CAN_BIN44]
MNTKLDFLKQRFEYEAWRGRKTLEQNLFIWKFMLSGSEFPGWQAAFIQPLEIPEFPPFIQSIWQRLAAEPGALLRVDVYECDSLLAAHEFLLQLLDTFQSPLIQRQIDSPIGDVAFAPPGDVGIIFARANLVVSIHNADQTLIPIAEIAQQFDHYLSSRPEISSIRSNSGSSEVSLSVEDSPIGTLVSLAVGALAEAGRSQWYKFFYPTGEILRQGEQLKYRLAAINSPEFIVFPIDISTSIPG